MSELDYKTEMDSDSECQRPGDKVSHDNGDGNWSSKEQGGVDVVVCCGAPIPQHMQQDAVGVRQPLLLPPSLQQLPQQQFREMDPPPPLIPV